MCYLTAREAPRRILKHQISVERSSQQQRQAGVGGGLLTFPSAANCLVSEATPALLEVGTRPPSVPGWNGYLAAPLCAADATRRGAGRPGTPRSHHAVNGCWENRERSAERQHNSTFDFEIGGCILTHFVSF